MRVTDIANSILREDTPRSSYPENIYKIKTGYDQPYEFKMLEKDKDGFVQGVLYPDTSINRVYESMLISEDAKYALSSFIILLTSNDVISSREEFTQLVLVEFSLFHEEGHWEFLKTNYINNGIPENRYWDDYKTHPMYIENIGTYNLSEKENNPQIRGELKAKYWTIYRFHPFEKYADNDAIERLKQIYL